MLVNEGEQSATIETVMSYQYDKVLYWGTVEGVSRGLPTEVFETGKPKVQVNWGLSETLKKVDVSLLDKY